MAPRSYSSINFQAYLSTSVFLHREDKVHNEEVQLENSGSSFDFIRTSSHNEYLRGHRSHLRCASCSTDICLSSQIISKGFTGRHGRAYLVSPSPASAMAPRESKLTVTPGLLNTMTGAPSQRQLVTGLHTVSDVCCAFCNSVLGWKYDAAEQASQQYKVGKFILETKMICTGTDWNGNDKVESYKSLTLRGMEVCDTGDVQFDSQDEDECEDLFAGVWSPTLAMQRRHKNISANRFVRAD